MIIVLSVVFLFLILRFAVTLFNFVSNPKLRRVVRYYSDTISILIPARNESGNIIALLKSITEQDYTQYEVLVLDDNSQDNTLSVCKDFALTHPKIKVIEGLPLPKGWTGKNYACYQLAQQAKGKYLLFIDAGAQVQKGLINAAVHRMESKNLGLLSLFPDQLMLTFGEKLVVPLMHFLLLNLMPLKLVSLSKNMAFTAASGQFMLFDATVYKESNWHEQYKSSIAPETAVMRGVKTAGYIAEVLLANGLVVCRSYKNFTEAIDGFSRNLLPVFNYSILALLSYLVLVIGGPLVIIATLNLQLMLFMFGIIMLGRSMVSLAAGQNRNFNMFLHPLQMVVWAYIGFLSIQRHLTKTNIWKGRKV